MAREPFAIWQYGFPARSEKWLSAKNAMRSFWQTKNRAVIITALNPNGIKTPSGKLIKWSEAAQKARARQIDLTPKQRERLINILRAKGWGSGLIPAL